MPDEPRKTQAKFLKRYNAAQPFLRGGFGYLPSYRRKRGVLGLEHYGIYLGN